MITNRQRYEDRHRRICKRAEERFAEDRAKNPKLTVPKTVRWYARAVRLAIKRRDSIAAVYATCACHLALHVPLD